MNDNFEATVRRSFSPYSPMSGTEHVAPLLYSLIRMTRPTTVVEFGSGYTTAYLAAALAENQRQSQEDKRALTKRIERDREAIEAVLSSGESQESLLPLEGRNLLLRRLPQLMFPNAAPVGPNPLYYVSSRSPHLFVFEALPAAHGYVSTLTELLDVLGLSDYVSLSCGVAVDHYTGTLPADRRVIDFAWNDHFDKFTFVRATYPLLNPDQGLLILHSPAGFPSEVDAIRDFLADDISRGHCELLTLMEPHKLTQNGCLLIRKSACRPRDPLATIDTTLEALRTLSNESGGAGS